MKKLFGLLLALCLIIGLLPVTTFAASEKAYLKLAHLTAAELADGQTKYYKTDTNNYAQNATGVEDATIIATYEDGVLTLTLKGVTLKDHNPNYGGFNILIFGNSTYNDFDVDIVIDGACTLDCTAGGYGDLAIKSNITGVLTIEDTGEADDSLTIKDKSSAATQRTVDLSGDLVIDGAKVSVKDRSGDGGSAIGAKNVTVQNGGELTAFAYTRSVIVTTENITIENSSLTVSNKGDSPLLNATGNINITNSSVLAGTNDSGKDGSTVFNKAPNLDFTASNNVYTFEGSISSPSVSGSDSTLGEIDASGITGNNLLKTYNAAYATTGAYACYRYFNIAPCAHTTITDHDGDCTTAEQCSVCGTSFGTAEAAHVGPDQTDCTVAVACTNTGCTKNVHEATTHTGGTATCIAKAVCTVCNNSYGDFAAHTPKAGEYACNVAHPCAVEGCTANYRDAGVHTGGTATCTKKAECSSCGVEYGELAAHTPEADDKDCATAIKCSVCKAETTAAKEHKYTDNSDTTCDNAGCEHARKVDAPTTKPNTNNVPQTGDSFNMVLWVSLLAISVVGFVSLMVFRKKHA